MLRAPKDRPRLPTAKEPRPGDSMTLGTFELRDLPAGELLRVDARAIVQAGYRFATWPSCDTRTQTTNKTETR